MGKGEYDKRTSQESTGTVIKLNKTYFSSEIVRIAESNKKYKGVNMKQKLNYEDYIGRFFERETMNDSSLFYKITGYDRKHYIVEEISLFPGFGC